MLPTVVPHRAPSPGLGPAARAGAPVDEWTWDACLIRLVNETIEAGAVPTELTGCVPDATPPAFDLSH